MIAVALADAATTRALRTAVLRAGMSTGDRPAPGDAEDAIHLAAWDGAELVGAAVLLPRPLPPRPDVDHAVQLRGMAVAPGHRGTGIGALIVVRALQIAAARGDELLWCNARSTARGFYERLGLRAEGEEFISTETGIPHFLMWRTVADDPR